MKKLLFVLSLFCIGMLNIKAESIYYTNSNGVTFTESQYKYFSKIYWEGYQEYMNQEDFDYYDINMMDENLVVVKYDYSKEGRATSTGDSSKTLKIASAAGTNYDTISVTLTWSTNPTVKSYDVIGARLENTSLLNTPTTRLYNNLGNTSFDISVSSNNGFGASILLSGSNLKINQSFRVSKGGTVYASYQHAESTISLANSKKYTISSSGYGKVFKFTGTAASVYDGMSGVSISV